MLCWQENRRLKESFKQSFTQKYIPPIKAVSCQLSQIQLHTCAILVANSENKTKLCYLQMLLATNIRRAKQCNDHSNFYVT